MSGPTELRIFHLDDEVLRSASLRTSALLEAFDDYAAVDAAAPPRSIAEEQIRALDGQDEGQLLARFLRQSLARGRGIQPPMAAIDVGLARRLFEERWLGPVFEAVRGQTRAWSNAAGHAASVAPAAVLEDGPAAAITHRPRAEALWQLARFDLAARFEVVVSAEELPVEERSRSCLIAESERRWRGLREGGYR